MIHHISLAVNDPLHVAQVVAELWQGRAIPFPHYPGSYFAVNLDPYGTAIEFFPKGTVLKPDSTSVGFYNSSAATGYTATHANLAVPISEAEIYKIADREGWRAIRCRRADLFDLIEFWLENEVLLELMPPSLMEEYRAMVQPENLKLVLDSAAFQHN
ncbi:hypothetical protein K9N68_04580 [Kovacikia minuta CCNUW1]|uniref:hypothetical protein n=1 Tax=Kovacikia minuta TaxID=2931930 RepID=UPI001CCD0834|nr:hypothetical protein [Kovacikia minuta]UBF27246.1 hypothetical protein K9N68_04580 [Kovacikia minuta CCNUW1]